jgi:hypothetical protein
MASGVITKPVNAGSFSGLRFKNLGTSPTSAQCAAVASDDMSELWNGDYWQDGNRIWRIVDNRGIARRRGDTNFDKPSLIIMPDDCLVPADGSTHLMNDTDTTAGGYKDTKYRLTYRSICRSIVDSWCGSSHVATHKELISTAVTDGKASSFAWESCDVELPTEFNIYGGSVWSSSSPAGSGNNVGSQWGQFALFQLAPYMAINRSQNYWLRDVASASWFARVDYNGSAYSGGASATYVGFRPFFIFIGA